MLNKKSRNLPPRAKYSEVIPTYSNLEILVNKANTSDKIVAENFRNTKDKKSKNPSASGGVLSNFDFLKEAESGQQTPKEVFIDKSFSYINSP